MDPLRRPFSRVESSSAYELRAILGVALEAIPTSMFEETDTESWFSTMVRSNVGIYRGLMRRASRLLGSTALRVMSSVMAALRHGVFAAGLLGSTCIARPSRADAAPVVAVAVTVRESLSRDHVVAVARAAAKRAEVALVPSSAVDEALVAAPLAYDAEPTRVLGDRLSADIVVFLAAKRDGEADYQLRVVVLGPRGRTSREARASAANFDFVASRLVDYAVRAVAITRANALAGSDVIHLKDGTTIEGGSPPGTA